VVAGLGEAAELWLRSRLHGAGLGTFGAELAADCAKFHPSHLQPPVFELPLHCCGGCV
jgi:hypothetical protein